MAPVLAGLYAIVDVPHPHGLDPPAVTRAVLGDRLDGGAHGAAVVQLRAKHATTAERVQWLRAMAGPCRDAGVPLVANDDVEAAIEAEVDGLHLGQDDAGADAIASIRERAPKLLVGLSTHDLVQLRDADRQQPDYLAYGPVGITRSKQNPDPVVGLAGLTDACRATAKPLVAIGGLDERLASRVVELGAAMAAVISALVHADLEATRRTAIQMSRSLEDAARPLDLDEVAARIPVISRDTLAEIARWSDSLSIHLGLKLPARFAPRVEEGRVLYRPSDVVDLCDALGKHPRETWDDWRSRDGDDNADGLVRLRRS